MKPRTKQIALLTLVLVCGGWILANAARRWGSMPQRGWSGMRFNYRLSTGEPTFTVESVIPLGPAARAGIEVNDRIVAINGKRERLREANRGFKPGETVIYTIERDGKERDVAVRLENPFRRMPVLIELALDFLVGLAFLTVGMLVYWKRPHDHRALIFFFSCSMFGLGRLMAMGPRYPEPTPQGAVMAVAFLAVSFLFFPALLHFSLIFPRRRPILDRHPAVLRWIYGLPAISVLVVGGLSTLALMTARRRGRRPGPRDEFSLETLFAPMAERASEYRLEIMGALFAVMLPLAVFLILRWRRAIRERGWKTAILGHPGLAMATMAVLPAAAGSSLEIGGMVFGASPAFHRSVIEWMATSLAVEFAACTVVEWIVIPVAACVAVYRSYREAGVEEKQQVRWPLWGILIAVPGYFLLPPLASATAWILGLDAAGSRAAILRTAGDYLHILVLLFIPVSFAFAILKYRLMEINIYIRRTVVYGGVTGLLGLMYLGLVGGVGALVSRSTGATSQWVAIVSTLAVAVAFVPVRNRVQSFVDRRFFRRRQDYPAALSSLSRDVADSRDQAQLFNTAVDRLQEALQNRSVVLFLRPQDERAFVPAAKVGIPDAVSRRARFAADGPLARSLTSIAAPPEDVPEEERRMVEELGGVLLVPMRRRDELIGFLSLGGKLSDEDYDRQDMDFLSAAANQIAVAIENLRFEQQEREFEKAREIQQRLLPARIPQAPGIQIAGAWQPARAVGGDYYDVLELGEGRLALVIADVSGKGVPAALLMSNVQAAVKTLASEAASPKDLCERVNRLITSNISVGQFITLFYGVLDTRTMRLVYTNAGHLAPILWRASGTVERLETGGLILGVSKAAVYEQDEVTLEPGDKLLLFTDGLSEAFNGNDEEFGEERLTALLAASQNATAEEIGRSVLGAVSRFSNNNFHDDATLIAVTVEPAAACGEGKAEKKRGTSG
ncbi:MAG TPA: SpoIIE family protein phosphatase [Bryobacteraceae bacterium]|nr:SpoIIE family protein phosphatase [Bryobacteraceae bacterium]HOQ46380.1 SpoIIE family protein phosphatase [Bryobacteraceae bacterium]HPQ14248.1 SpoIIE family protein phosphatase [Bryobacteraceae bacterium]HPU72183.1 SpoIIE family protein phosphatase [Bryobacteraceae bacterium]